MNQKSTGETPVTAQRYPWYVTENDGWVLYASDDGSVSVVDPSGSTLKTFRRIPPPYGLRMVVL